MPCRNAFGTRGRMPRQRGGPGTLQRDTTCARGDAPGAGWRSPVLLSRDVRSIERCVISADENKLRAIIVGGATPGVRSIADGAQNVAVIIGGTHVLPSRRSDAVDATSERGEELSTAGVPFAMAAAATVTRPQFAISRTRPRRRWPTGSARRGAEGDHPLPRADPRGGRPGRIARDRQGRDAHRHDGQPPRDHEQRRDGVHPWKIDQPVEPADSPERQVPREIPQGGDRMTGEGGAAKSRREWSSGTTG